jgi:acyl-CoA synthetase (AMP-forming)/AMP-acid ligase II
VVTVQLPNWIDFACTFFAIERLGAVAIQVSTDFRAHEIGFILRFSESAAFVCAREHPGFRYLPMATALAAELPALRLLACTEQPDEPGVVSLEDAVWGRERAHGFAPVRADPHEVFRMAFTSGTTGNPKAVLHNHETTLSAARIQNQDLGITEDEVFLLYLPLGLNWGYLALVQAIVAGGRAVLLDRFSAREALALVDRERVTYVPTAPASIISMLNAPELEQADLGSLRLVVSGGASCPVETIREFRRKMTGSFLELYGMLESGFHAYTPDTDDPERVSGTVGKTATGLGLRILDDDGNDVPAGQEGEIAGKGPSIHLGYHNNPRANEEAFTADGWFRTGDLGFLDPDGNLVISGRSKEIINRGGKKFHPREVEEILYTHPRVQHAAIVGVRDPRLGERTCLCVVPRPGQSVTLEEMLEMLRGRVATYKLPEFFRIVEVLPFTPPG